MAHYLVNPICKFYYDEIKNKTDSDESDVDNFYNNILPLYFPSVQRYGIERESRMLKELGIDKRTDFTVRCIRNWQTKKIIVVEYKRKSLESQDAVWRSALNQAIAYVQLIRTEKDQNDKDPIHIIIAIGTYLRAYTHKKGANDAELFSGHPNEPLELSDDVEKIHNILKKMNSITKQ